MGREKEQAIACDAADVSSDSVWGEYVARIRITRKIWVVRRGWPVVVFEVVRALQVLDAGSREAAGPFFELEISIAPDGLSADVRGASACARARETHARLLAQSRREAEHRVAQLLEARADFDYRLARQACAAVGQHVWFVDKFAPERSLHQGRPVLPL